ncbi:MAG: hypothetical protein ACKVOP_05865 [Sphingomonadaceae bacterium]
MTARAAAAIALVLATPAAARTSLGTYDGWGAFRDPAPPRCYAIAEPIRSAGGRFRPFLSIATWPQAGAKGQVHVRLSRPAPAGAAVSLVVNDRRFPLTGSGPDAWAPNAAFDAGIVANLRSARTLTVEVRGAFTETYVLKGAATAIDAAALGCARR